MSACVCEGCEGKIKDEHRARMMRRGSGHEGAAAILDSTKAAAVIDSLGMIGGDGASLTDGYEWHGWKHAGWITGTPVNDGRDAGYQLSSLYALTLGWGDIAAEFVESIERPQNLRNFINGWLAETWELIARKTTWQMLGERIIDQKSPREQVPAWASLLTIGIDHQSTGGDRFPFVVDAWGQPACNADDHVRRGRQPRAAEGLGEREGLPARRWRRAAAALLHAHRLRSTSRTASTGILSASDCPGWPPGLALQGQPTAPSTPTTGSTRSAKNSSMPAACKLIHIDQSAHAGLDRSHAAHQPAR